MKKTDPREVERKVLQCFAKLLKKSGEVPRAEDVADAVTKGGYHMTKSTVTAAFHRLDRKGLMTPPRVIPRKITPAGEEWL